MAYHKDATLQIEQLQDDEAAALRIESTAEMVSILKDIASHGTHVALYYNDDQEFILTVLLDADEDGMWLDAGPSAEENKRLLLSDRITLVSVHQHVKIQFSASGASSVAYQDSDAFHIELPEYMLRVQRRDFFRVNIPAATPVTCIIPLPPKEPGDPPGRRTVPVLDISGGGVGLFCEGNEETLQPGSTFHDCRIALPGIGTLTFTLEVRNNIRFTTDHGAAHIRAGCSFIRMDNQTSLQLLGFITKLQREMLAKS